MNTSISDMASFPIPPLGSHWSHESDLIGDLFDLTICIIIFRCPTDGISIALVQSEAIIFKIVPIGFEIYICMLAVRPAVSHKLSVVVARGLYLARHLFTLSKIKNEHTCAF